MRPPEADSMALQGRKEVLPGRAQPGSTAAAATNNGDGTWSFTVPAALTSGNHHVVVTASDTIGNTYQTTASITVTDDSQTGGSGSGSGSGSGNQSGTTGGNQSTVTVTPNNDGHVLGDTTDTSDTDSKGKIKGDKTVNIATAADKHAGNFLGLGWWWLLFVAILAGGWWFLAAKRRKQDEN